MQNFIVLPACLGKSVYSIHTRVSLSPQKTWLRDFHSSPSLCFQLDIGHSRSMGVWVRSYLWVHACVYVSSAHPLSVDEHNQAVENNIVSLIQMTSNPCTQLSRNNSCISRKLTYGT